MPPTHTAFLSPLTLSVLLPLPSPLPNKRTYTYALKKKEKKKHGLNRPSAADMLITLHSNKTNDFLRQTSVDQVELLPLLLAAISSTKTRREINDLSECQCGVGPGLKHKAHRGKMGTPPLSVE